MTASPAADVIVPRPQDDLFRHVNGPWLATAEIPADRSADGAFYQLRDEAEKDSRAIIEDAAAAADGAEPGSPVQLIGGVTLLLGVAAVQSGTRRDGRAVEAVEVPV